MHYLIELIKVQIKVVLVILVFIRCQFNHNVLNAIIHGNIQIIHIISLNCIDSEPTNCKACNESAFRTLVITSCLC